MLHAPNQYGAVDPGLFSILSFEADYRELHNPVFPNKKRNLLKRTKQIKTIFLETNDGIADEHMKVIPEPLTCEIESRRVQGDISHVFPEGSENATHIEELYNSTTDNVAHVTPLTISPRSYDASEPISATPSPKPCDTLLPVSTTATPGLGDTSCVTSTQATDEQESNDDDKQIICGTTSPNVSRTTTIHEVEETHNVHGGHQNKTGEIREDKMPGLSTLSGTGNKSDAEHDFTSGVGQAESVEIGKEFEQNCEKLERISEPNNALLQV